MTASFTEEDFQQILKKEGIHDELLMGNTSLLQDIALLLHEWKSLSRYLKLDEPTIRQIQEDNKDNFIEQKFQCLYKWVQLNGKDATLVNLLWVVYIRLKDKLLIHQIAQCLKDVLSQGTAAKPQTQSKDEDKENRQPASTPVKLQSPMNDEVSCSKCSKT